MIKSISCFFDRTASHLTTRGYDALQFLREVAVFDHQFFSLSDADSVLRGAGLMSAQWFTGVSRTTVTAVAAASPFLYPGVSLPFRENDE